MKETSEKFLNQLEINQIKYHSLYSFNSDAIFIINSAGYIVELNEAAQDLSGYSLEEIKGCFFLDLIDLEDRGLVFEKLQKAVTGSFEDFQLHFLHRNHCRIKGLVQFIPVNDECFEEGMFLLVKDMRVMELLSDRCLESEKNFRIIAENVQDVIVLLDNQKRYLFVSPSCKKMFGFEPRELLNNEQPFLNVHQEYKGLIEDKFNQSIENGQSFSLIIKILHKENGWIWSEVNGTPVFDKSNNFQHMVIVVRDISYQKAYEEELKHFAFYDSLTGLPNRRFFYRRLSESIERLNTTGKHFTIVFLDIDDFKLINDEWGHEVGDRVIVEFAKRINHTLENQGIVARLGGDEFIILLDDISSEEDVIYFIENLKRKMLQEFTIEDLSIPVTTSIGVSICTTKNMNDSYFVKSADIALYNVKERGKNQYHINYS
nr:sensor domain-containing diguanylate cyclase [Lysinibacillus timonensis]